MDGMTFGKEVLFLFPHIFPFSRGILFLNIKNKATAKKRVCPANKKKTSFSAFEDRLQLSAGTNGQFF